MTVLRPFIELLAIGAFIAGFGAIALIPAGSIHVSQPTYAEVTK